MNAREIILATGESRVRELAERCGLCNANVHADGTVTVFDDGEPRSLSDEELTDLAAACQPTNQWLDMAQRIADAP